MIFHGNVGLPEASGRVESGMGGLRIWFLVVMAVDSMRLMMLLSLDESLSCCLSQMLHGAGI